MKNPKYIIAGLVAMCLVIGVGQLYPTGDWLYGLGMGISFGLFALSFKGEKKCDKE
ncbi:MAG: hypothetical protein R3Y27_05755 [Clostridia bacterium]